MRCIRRCVSRSVACTFPVSTVAGPAPAPRLLQRTPLTTSVSPPSRGCAVPSASRPAPGCRDSRFNRARSTTARELCISHPAAYICMQGSSCPRSRRLLCPVFPSLKPARQRPLAPGRRETDPPVARAVSCAPRRVVKSLAIKAGRVRRFRSVYTSRSVSRLYLAP